MISHELVTHVRKLLAEDAYSHRQIARLTGVSRATIGSIANGRRRDRLPRDAEDDMPPFTVGIPQRCGGCGGLVFMPCWLCRVRDMKRLDHARHLARQRLTLPLRRIRINPAPRRHNWHAA